MLARALRIQYEDALYHVTCRGNELKEIFKDNHDKSVFLELLNDGLKTYNIILYCYVLMDNHFHLLLKTSLANLRGRKRLREKLKGNRHHSQIVERIEADLSM